MPTNLLLIKRGEMMKYIVPTLQTERLILRKGSYEDYVKVYEYDFTRLRNIAGEFEYVKNDPEKLKGFETYADEEENVLDFIIYLKDSNQPIGNIVFDRYDEKNKSLEISCNLHPNYWKKGYMTEAILSSMEYVFSNLDIDNILYGFAEENYKSRGLSEKIGFDFYADCIEHYKRIDKDIKEIQTIMSKENFNKKYGTNNKRR